MDARVQRRVQRYGWDLAADCYEALWQAQLAPAHHALLEMARLKPGERVLDVACGTGLVSFEAARKVGPDGSVVGVDLSGVMVTQAEHGARAQGLANAHFQRMDGESLALQDASFDVVICALGLMYMPDPAGALGEMRRVLKPGGRVLLAVWGERARCGWSPVFPIIDAQVRSDVCPLFFQLGQGDALARLCTQTGLDPLAVQRIGTTLAYADAQQACQAVFVGGPAALAWSRFDEQARALACEQFIAAIDCHRRDGKVVLPGEFVVVAAQAGSVGKANGLFMDAS